MSVINMLPQGGLTSADLLWTNNSPTTSRDSLTVTADLSNYTAVIVESNAATDNTNSSYSFVKKGATDSKSYVFAWVSTRRANGRQITTFNDSRIVFGNGFVGASGNNNNSACIPVKIYGVRIKGVS